MAATHLTIELNLEGAAFEEPGPEIARILGALAEAMRDFPRDYPVIVRDINGNAVGTVTTS